MYQFNAQVDLSCPCLYSITRLSALYKDSGTDSWSLDRHGKFDGIELSLADTFTASWASG